ncbi:MAG: response regulator [Magnetospirillum sp.]|nr:response regulator [Magnetospirillum sp.]
MSKENILVVDDEPQILTAISDLLEDEFTVWTASDGPAALKILAEQDMAVILSDQRMPGMTGAELLGHVRQVSDATRVLVTGYSDLDALVKAVNLGQIHAYLSKPWNPLELKVVVRTAADRWRLGRTLERERTLLQALMDNVPDAIFFKDASLHFTRINPAQAAMLGLDSVLEAQGHMLGDLIPHVAADPVEAQERQLIESGTPLIDQVEAVVDPSGATTWMSTTKVPIRMGQKIVGLAGISRDITKRKQAEDLLRRSHDDLQKAVDERTAWLRQEISRRTQAEEEARAARDVAESSSRAKSTFLANMSHELRTPLNAIIGFAELTESQMNDAERAKLGGFVADIGESAHHLLRVINDILDVARVEAGKIDLHETIIFVPELIQSAVRLTIPSVTAKQQMVMTSCPDHLPRIKGDERLIKQILLNLVINASKFSGRGGRITIDAAHADGVVRLTIADDGCGIAAEDIPKVLQPFGQVHNLLAPKQEGTGLGLPLAREFMELHGGSLELKSELGRGTTVVLTFPPVRVVA